MNNLFLLYSPSFVYFGVSSCVGIFNEFACYSNRDFRLKRALRDLLNNKPLWSDYAKRISSEKQKCTTQRKSGEPIVFLLLCNPDAQSWAGYLDDRARPSSTPLPHEKRADQKEQQTHKNSFFTQLLAVNNALCSVWLP